MSEFETILRVAAKGDGVTASGRHVALAAPGDAIDGSGAVRPGPHHARPPCRHFPTCGGCQLQHLDEETLAAFVRDRVVNAALSQGLEPGIVAPVHLSPPRTRRRATLHGVNGGGRTPIGFREAGSHRVAPGLIHALPSGRLRVRRQGRGRPGGRSAGERVNHWRFQAVGPLIMRPCAIGCTGYERSDRETTRPLAGRSA